jgi:hypothetical protein
MTQENQAKLNANTAACNALTDEQLFDLFKQGKCPREPEHLIGVPLGMFHCEVCGIMVVAGMHHPPIKWIGDFATGYADYPDSPDYPHSLLPDDGAPER